MAGVLDADTHIAEPPRCGTTWTQNGVLDGP